MEVLAANSSVMELRQPSCQGLLLFPPKAHYLVLKFLSSWFYNRR